MASKKVEPAHALLSASGAARWLACPPSARLEATFPKSSSTYAEEGTEAHALAELVTRYWLGEITETEYETNLAAAQDSMKYYTAEMLEHAVDYARFVTEKLKAIREDCPDAFAELEVKVDFSKWVPGGFGTGDCIIIADDWLEIIDFKYGKGYRVEAIDNPQMKLYALGAFERYNTLFDIKNVRMTIIQPRLSSGQSSDELPVQALTKWARTFVKPRAKLADAGEGEFSPSEGACKFCRAKEKCRARAEHNLKLFDEAPDLELISVDEAGAILEKAKDIKTWLSDLENLVLKTLFTGETVKGWKLVEGRSNRKFADETAVEQALKAAGYDEALLYDKKLIPLTQMEKDFGKKEIATVLDGLIIKPQGKPTLALESDKRPAIALEDQVLAAFDEE